jgi:hypothetical protein
LYPALAIDQFFTDPANRPDRADLGAAESGGLTDARSDQHAPPVRQADVVKQIATSHAESGG